MSPDRKIWISCRPGFFLSVRVLSRLFRRLFLQALRQAFTQKQLQVHGQLAGQEAGLPQLLDQPGRIEWVVYAKPPFGGAAQVLDYLGRYTHRVAISNDRLLNREDGQVEDGQVTFQYKDYRSQDPQKSRSMTVTAEEFIRRFLLHAIPAGFQRIRHYGLLATRNKKQTLALSSQLLDIECELLPTRAEVENYRQEVLAALVLCPRCGKGPMIRMETIFPCRWPNQPLDSS